jgi:signal peptidase II
MKAVPAKRYVVFFSIAICGCLFDLATKSWIFNWLGTPPGPTWWIWEDVCGFQTSLNEGGLFGMGQGMVVVFSALSVVAAVAILVWLFIAGAARDLLLTVALGLVTAGIFGNLYDRLGLPGLKWTVASSLHDVGDPVYAVRDWILVMIGDWPWPNFNLADSFLVCGAILLFWHAVRRDASKEPDAKAQKRPAGQK